MGHEGQILLVQNVCLAVGEVFFQVLPSTLQGHRDMEAVTNADGTELQDVVGTFLRKRSESPDYKQGGFLFVFLSN